MDYEDDAINLNNAYPTSDLEGLENQPYIFVITNNCSKATNYEINLESLNKTSNTLNSDYVKVALSSDYMDNIVTKLSDNESTEPLINGSYESHNLYRGTLDSYESHSFSLKEWLDYDTTVAEGANKVFYSKINVIARPDIEVENSYKVKTAPRHESQIGTMITRPKDINETNNILNIMNVKNDDTYPFKYDETTKKYTSTNKEIDSYSKISLSAENENTELCYDVSGYSSYTNINFEINSFLGIANSHSGCIYYGNTTLNDKMEVIYSNYENHSSVKNEISFYLNEKPISFKYCISDKNICEPDKDGIINKSMLDVKMYGEKIICTKVNNGKTYCSDKYEFDESLDTNFLKDNVEKEKIESITTLNKINIPDNAIKSWDASSFENGSIIAYYTDTDNNGKYELYLAGDGKVKAPYYSTELFCGFTNVTTMNLSNFDTSNVTNMGGMFYVMDNLTSLDLRKADFNNVTNYTNILTSLNSLKTIIVKDNSAKTFIEARLNDENKTGVIVSIAT